MSTIVLTSAKHHDYVRSILPQARLADSVETIGDGVCLIGYQTGVVVPAAVLERFGRAYNIHAATPDFPGRDPHHWAAYAQAASFGATAHVMTAEVDQGWIVGTIAVGVPKDSGPDRYREVGAQCARALFEVLAPRMVTEGAPAIRAEWTGPVRRRRDLIAMCDMRGLESWMVEHRRMAFAGFERHFLTD